MAPRFKVTSNNLKLACKQCGRNEITIPLPTIHGRLPNYNECYLTELKDLLKALSELPPGKLGGKLFIDIGYRGCQLVQFCTNCLPQVYNGLDKEPEITEEVL